MNCRLFWGRIPKQHFVSTQLIHAMLPRMSDQKSDDGQRRDALLRRLLKSPPLLRAETAEQLRRATHAKPKSQRKAATAE
jgi:hypothetical protein